MEENWETWSGCTVGMMWKVGTHDGRNSWGDVEKNEEKQRNKKLSKIRETINIRVIRCKMD